MDLNKVMIIGRLTRDPETRTTPSGVNNCQVSVATNYVYTNQQTGQKVEQVEYHNIVMWRKLGEIAQQYLKKGSQVFIEGRLQTSSWEAKEGGKKYKTEIIADNMIMLGSKSGASPSGSFGGSAPQANPSPAPRANSAPANDFMQAPATEELPTINQDEDVNVEDIPF